jgi:hypothetical protein
VSPAPFLVAAVALAAGFLLGRTSAPERVELQQVERVRVEWRERETSAAVSVGTQSKATRREVRRSRVTTPDGTVREREVEREVDEQHQAHAEQRLQLRDASGTAEAHRELRQVTSTARSTWRAGALVGLQLQALKVPPGPLVYGAHVERRVLGPLWLGAWGLSSRTAGLSLSAEF